MTWNYEQERRNWYETEAGQLLERSQAVQSRTRNAIMRHYIFQYNPYTSHMYRWKMVGDIGELELIAEDKRLIAGIGVKGKENLQEVLDEVSVSERGNNYE